MISRGKWKGKGDLRPLYFGRARWSALLIATAVICGSAAPVPGSALANPSWLGSSANYRQWGTDSAARTTGSQRFRLSLQGSNDYRLTVMGSDKGAILAVSRGHAAAIYMSTRASIDSSGLTAKFGHLGIVSVKFEPSGRLRARDAPKVPVGCKLIPEKAVDQLGTFVGEIRFRGEEGFTVVTKNHAAGSVGPIQRHICKSRPSNNPTLSRKQARATRVSPLLRAVASGRNIVDFRIGRGAISTLAAFGFRANLRAEDLPSAGTPFSVISTERKQAMNIVRLAIARGGPSSFVFNKALTAATVSPPPPFSGVGHFRSCPARRWSGPISVSLPGKRGEALTGRRFLFGAKLRPEGNCPKSAFD